MSLITIVVPIYGTEQYLHQCLDTILEQEHENLEILCVDDCSPDSSADIVRDYAAKDARIQLLQHEVNQGLGPARNTGIRAAKGDLIGFVDSDDWIDPQMFRVLYETLLSEDADVVQCSSRNIQDGQDIGSYPVSAGARRRYTMHSMFGRGPKLVGAAWNKLYKTSLFRDNNIYYPAILFEDVATTPRLVHQARKVASVSESYLNYRYRDDSIVNSVNPKTLIRRLDGLFSAARILEQYFTSRNSHSLEFILNFRHYIKPQLERNIRIAGELDEKNTTLPACMEMIRSHLTPEHSYCRYFFPDSVAWVQRLQEQADAALFAVPEFEAEALGTGMHQVHV